jgi:hypothetical protein
MERLMVIRLVAQGCNAELWLNGLPVASVSPQAPQVVVPVHEAACVGPNRLELVVDAAGQAGISSLRRTETALLDMAAQVQLLLPRMGTSIDESKTRTLARMEWTCPRGEALSLPVRRMHDAELPIRLPRWRWLDAPVVAQPSAELKLLAHGFVTGLARDLARGQCESFMAATRLRTEELALAYQRSPESEATRLREWLEQMYASSRLVWQPLAPEEVQLRPLAGGRLLECLGGDGRGALTTVPDEQGNTLVLPLKLSVVEGRFYVLR